MNSLAISSDLLLRNLTSYAMVWSIWIGRNDLQFNSKQFKVSEVWDLHILRVAWWTKTIWYDCPYDVNQFSTNFCNIKVSKKITLPKVAFWFPPSLGYLKFNVDGSSQGNPGPCRVGGVLRNHNNEILGYFSKGIGQ